ncbi:MAG: mercuric ion binding protein [Cyclobacteriaceae bacterium]|jgi:mercuric ion binding protein
MMRLSILFIALFGMLNAYSQSEPTKTADGFEVKILTSAVCEMCKYTIEKDLAFEKGVKSSDLDVDSKILTVVYSKRTDADKLRKRISEIGYHADEVNRVKKAYDALPSCCQDGAHGSAMPHKPQ